MSFIYIFLYYSMSITTRLSIVEEIYDREKKVFSKKFFASCSEDTKSAEHFHLNLIFVK